jgi:hypothetical protein
MRQDLTEVIVVLDRSGSMASIAKDMCGGFDTFIAEQRQQPGELRVSLHQFDDVHETVYENRNVQEVGPLVLEPRSMTALLDAVGRAITSTGQRFAAMPEHERPHKVIFMIITDGHENASREYTRDRIRGMIQHQESKYGWTFVFLGANQNAFGEAQAMGVQAGNTMNFAANAVGTQEAYKSFSGKISSVRSRSAGHEQLTSGQFYNQTDYDAQTNAGAQHNPTASTAAAPDNKS